MLLGRISTGNAHVSLQVLSGLRAPVNSILGNQLSVGTRFRLGGNDSEIVISIGGTVNRVQRVIQPCVVYFILLCCPIFYYLYALFIFFFR